jgi:predicted ATPase/DNA-binding SARP family transcriptional activator
MENIFRLSLLGPSQIAKADTRLRALETGKSLALLGYLVTHDQPITREYLSELFWPNKPANRGRANLSWLIHHITSKMPASLRVNRKTLQFKCNSPYWLDLDAFVEFVDQGDKYALSSASDLYRGEFLDGLYLSECADFEIWLVGERERWQRRLLDVLRKLVVYHEQSGQYHLGLRIARRILDIEPWLEETHRQVMRLYALSDQRSSALAYYKQCQHILNDELGVGPSKKTKQLYESIRDGGFPKPELSQELAQFDLRRNSPTFLDNAYPEKFEEPLFFSRKNELAILQSYLEKACNGDGHVLFVTGEAGSGKTALIQAFARHAQEQDSDLVFASGKCNTNTGYGDPYLPFREIIRLLSGDAESSWKAGVISREQALRLWSLLPLTIKALLDCGADLVETFLSGRDLINNALYFTPEGPVWFDNLKHLVEHKIAILTDRSLQQVGLFGQYIRLIQALASERPLLLFLDDLQWADTGSINLLFQLGRELAGHKILILGAYRPVELVLGIPSPGSEPMHEDFVVDRERHPLIALINEFKLTFGDIELKIPEDDPVFVEALLENEPNHLSESFRKILYRQTKGHPLFTIELLRSMQERGDLVKDEKNCWVEGSAINWEVLPARVEAMIAERIMRLPEYLQEILSLASVEGEFFTAEVLAHVTKTDEGDMLHFLSSYLDCHHRIVRSQGLKQIQNVAITMFRFRHILFQKYLYANIDSLERSYLHRMVGLELESIYGIEKGGDKTQIAEIAGNLARHFEAGGVLEKAVVYRLQAGQQATRISANDEALAHFTRGLSLLEKLPQSQHRDQQELAIQSALAVPLLAVKGFAAPEVGRTYARALDLCNQVAGAKQHFQVLWLSYTFNTTRGNHKKAYQLGEQLFSLAEKSKDAMLLAQAQWALGWSLFFLGELAQAKEFMQQVIEFYQPGRFHELTYIFGQDPSSACRAQFSWILWLMGFPDQALKMSSEAITIAQEINHPFSLAFAHGLSTLLYAMCLQIDEVRKASNLCIGLSEEHGFMYFVAFSLCMGSWAAMKQSLNKESIGQLHKGMALFKASGAEMGLPQQLAMLAEGCSLTGDDKQALDLLDEALKVIQRNNEYCFEPEILRLKGEITNKLVRDNVVGSKKFLEVDNCFKQAIAIAQKQGAKMWELRSTVSLARLWQQQGEIKKSHKKLTRIYNSFTEGLNSRDLLDAQALLESLSATRVS